jgi:hypothetical protein
VSFDNRPDLGAGGIVEEGISMSVGKRRYELRYCAFLDILGFSDLIGSIGKGDTGFEVVRDL